MKGATTIYRKNFSLILAFLILISVTLIISLIVAYSFTKKDVEGEFSARKDEVLKQTAAPYYDFFYDGLPQMSLYNGLLDTASAKKYIHKIFENYPFVKEITFYKVSLGGGNKGKLNIAPKAIFHYKEIHGDLKITQTHDAIDTDDFKHMADQVGDYIAGYDTSKRVESDRFYDLNPGKITSMNVLGRPDITTYHKLAHSNSDKNVSYPQNMMTFALNADSLKIKNSHRELYKNISIKNVFYDSSLDVDSTVTITDEIPLPSALSNYKLFFSSPRNYLTAEVNRRFMPTAGIIVLIYAFLVVIGWLIYRNLNVNLKLFKLQYDFINNFTHEFKTPVSVIKIAGSNLKGEGELTERQRKHYGRILDEEADKLNELMNKLLSFTQIENKSISIKKSRIEMEKFTQGYIDTFKIKYPDFKLHCNVSDVTYFNTDPVLLGSIFQNLMENAYKYSHPHHKELTIDISLDKRTIVCSFKDKGIGIPKNELNNIFKKFYRLENQYNQNGSVGLGLAFCKELANFMGGDITVHSKVEQGSEFLVTLPYES
jgi:two-component system phosphate regulon sensor histidine kinase PhoR